MSEFKFQNYVVLTATLSNLKTAESKAGKPYATADAVAKIGGEFPFRVVGTGPIVSVLREGQVTLTGRLGYEEKEKDGVKTQTFILFPEKIEPAPADGKTRNFADLTVRLGAEPVAKYTTAGALWTKLRVALGMGKDQTTGAYKPSLWLSVKAFTTKEGDESLPALLQSLSKGDLVTTGGRLAYEIYQGKGYLSLVASKAVVVSAAVPEEEAVPD